MLIEVYNVTTSGLHFQNVVSDTRSVALSLRCAYNFMTSHSVYEERFLKHATLRWRA